MNVLNYVGGKCYWYTFSKHRDRFYILFFWEILKGSATDYSQWSPTLTTYPLSSQLRLTCPHSSLLCWVYSLQLQALLAPGLLSTKDRFLRKCVYTWSSVNPFLHLPHCWHTKNLLYLTERWAWKGQCYSELKTKQIIKITHKRSRVAGCALGPSSWRPLQGPYLCLLGTLGFTSTEH